MKNRLAFVWQGISEPKILEGWKDGLWQAIEYLRSFYNVEYHEPDDDLSDFDYILYWEAPCTVNGKNSSKYMNVCNSKGKKILLFAGGPLEKEWVKSFDLVVVEADINVEDCKRQGIRHAKAFGINTDIFKPRDVSKDFLAVHHGACAGWKRQHLGAEALGDRFLVVGNYQTTDPYTFDRSKELGATVIGDKLLPEECAKQVSRAKILLQTSEFWGGGQRATLEGMSAGLCPVVMEDSPKNKEFIEGSGLGYVVRPEPNDIKELCNNIIWSDEDAISARNYVIRNWSGEKYGKDLLEAIKSI